jgi:hypothetical protein
VRNGISAARGPRVRRLIGCAAVALAVTLGIVALQNAAIGAYFPRLERVTTDFSPAYLRRELGFLAAAPPRAIFLGDSVLWGYRLQPSRTAVAVLAAGGCDCYDLALKSGSPPNYYALARLLEAWHVHPKAVVLEVNQKAFNQADDSFRTLHPAVAALAAPLLTPDDRKALALPSRPQGFAGWLDGRLSSVSALYAMRADAREVVYGDTDAAPVEHLTAALYEGAYDLTPLTADNLGVRYLERTAQTLRRAGIPLIAFMTPTNHTLLHEYIDVP